MLEPAAQDVEHDLLADVADVRRALHRQPAVVDRDLARDARDPARGPVALRCRRAGMARVNLIGSGDAYPAAASAARADVTSAPQVTSVTYDGSMLRVHPARRSPPPLCLTALAAAPASAATDHTGFARWTSTADFADGHDVRPHRRLGLGDDRPGHVADDVRRPRRLRRRQDVRHRHLDVAVADDRLRRHDPGPVVEHRRPRAAPGPASTCASAAARRSAAGTPSPAGPLAPRASSARPTPARPTTSPSCRPTPSSPTPARRSTRWQVRVLLHAAEAASTRQAHAVRRQRHRRVDLPDPQRQHQHDDHDGDQGAGGPAVSRR